MTETTRARAVFTLLAALVLVGLTLGTGSATAAATGAAAAPASVSAADASWCGAACNGVDPRTPVYVGSYKVVCANTARQVDGPDNPFAPAGEGQPLSWDDNVVIYHMYSTHCQTTWLAVRNLRAIGRTYCTMWELRTTTPRYRATGACPAAGTATTTPMVDDHDPQGRKISFGHLEESFPSAVPGPWTWDTNYY